MLNEMPKKAIRPDEGTERAKETPQPDTAEEVPVLGRTVVERETSQSKPAPVVTQRIKFEVTGLSLKKVVPRTSEKETQPLPKSDTAVQPAVHALPDKTVIKESEKTTLSAADIVDEAVKTTVTALAANREKTLESLKKLLSHALPTGKESDTGSNSKSSHRGQRSASSGSSSRSSDSSHR